MEEERQQKRLWNVQRHLPTKPRGQNVCQSPGTTKKVQSRTIHKRGTDGFQKRGSTDAVFALGQLSEKVTEYDRELNIVFDQEKAFDRVNRDKLLQTLEMYNIRGQLLDSIRAMYANSMSTVRTSEGLTDWFDITSGVRTGCLLSPFLILYMVRITKETNLEPEALNELLFADDQRLAHESE